MNNRIPLLTVALSFFLLAGVIAWVAVTNSAHSGAPNAPTDSPNAVAQSGPGDQGSEHEADTNATQAQASSQQPGQSASRSQPDAADRAEATPKAFSPPSRDAMPDDEFGALVRKGEQIFTDTQTHASQFVGNDLQCTNCHLDAGRLADSAPLWAAWGMYPKYRGKNKHVNDYAERLQGCFRYSMNGTPPPRGDEVLQALQAYTYWLAQDAPAGKKLDGAGYPALDDPEQKPDFKRGKQVFADHCALCHGDNGLGQRAANGAVAFPALWGEGSYNWGAGMHRVNTAAGFIKANMPLGAATLSEQQAWDVAQFVNSHDRPQDPRFNGSVEAVANQFHGEYSMYGKQVQGKRLGANSSPSGAVDD